MASSFLETAEEIAREAGALLLQLFHDGVAFELKGEFDLVTIADQTSEKLIVNRLKAHFPEHGIIAEEGGGHESQSEYRWYVDPVDGTTNFAHGYPVWNVTLALEKGDEMIAGVIFDPTRNEMFRAGRGTGAYLNQRQIHISPVRRLEDSLVSTGFPTGNRAKNPNIHFYHQLAMSTHGVRRGGSAALDLAYVACGRLEAFWEFGLKPWDLAAGRLLVQEAGGVVSDMLGQPHKIGPSAHLLTDNGLIHDQILELFAETFRGEMRHPMPRV
jgi:myo-inositol-1(or 4)-monophosphatase